MIDRISRKGLLALIATLCFMISFHILAIEANGWMAGEGGSLTPLFVGALFAAYSLLFARAARRIPGAWSIDHGESQSAASSLESGER